MKTIGGLMIGYILFLVLIIIGWIININAIVSMAGPGDVSTEFVLRCIGIIIFPIGALFGYFL